VKAKKQKIQLVHSRSSSGANVTFVKNSYSIHRLFIIHGEITGDRRGRRYNIDVLNKAAIIFITAYWEAYIEDVCKEFSTFILANCTDYKKFPKKGRLAASKKLVKQKDEREVWNLAGEGWKSVVSDYVDEFLDNFHTPAPNNVDELFKKLLDVPSLSSSWKWAGMSSVKAQSNLQKLIDTRNAIAHGRKPPASVTKKNAEMFLNFVETLVQKTDKYLQGQGKKLINQYPW